MKRSKPVSIKVPKDALKKAENLNAFLFDGKGELIEKVALKGGEVKLKTLASKVHGNSKLFIAG